MQSREAFTRRDPGVLKPAADGSMLSRGLGCLSLGSGLTELAAPRACSALNARDEIVKVTATMICGSDLLLYNGFMRAMQKGDILGHEFMGEVVELGKPPPTQDR